VTDGDCDTRGPGIQSALSDAWAGGYSMTLEDEGGGCR